MGLSESTVFLEEDDVGRARARDKQLLKAIRAGDVEAFEGLYRRFAPGLLGFILQRVPNRMEAEELLQETFLRLLKDRRFEPDTAGLSTYLYVIARNLCLTHRRDQAHRRFAPLQDARADQTVPMWGRSTSLPDEVADRHQEGAVLERALSMLPDAQREAFLLRHHHGLTYEEIAQVCGCPVGTAKSRVHLAVTALRVSLARLPDNVTPIASARGRGPGEHQVR